MKAPLPSARILDLLFLFAALSALSVLLMPSTPAWRERSITIVVSVSALAILWWVRWRRPRATRALTIPFVLLGVVTSFAADGLVALPLVSVGLVLVVVEFGAVAGAVMIVLLAIEQIVVMLLLGSSAGDALFQTFASATVFVFVYAFGVLLRRSEAERAGREELLAERDAVNARLVEANAHLRTSIEVQRDLVLADERARAARELHDGLGHRLTVARMSLDYAERARSDDPEAAWTEIGQARTVVEEALAEMRVWVRALNPVRIAGLTEPAAFEAIADAFRGTGVDVRIRVSGDEQPLPQDAALFCYRFVQEGLTNALRHAAASRVDLDVAFPDAEADVLRLTLTDDGRRSDEPVPRNGFGLRSLRERAETLGGAFDARRADDGFELSASVPLRSAVS